MIEEIAAKTKARFLIIDPNSDFAKFSAVNPKAWEEHAGKFLTEDTRENFEKRWSRVGFRLVTTRDADALGEPRVETQRL
jgi:hypothetical protein